MDSTDPRRAAAGIGESSAAPAPAPGSIGDGRQPSVGDLELAVARLLTLGTYLSVALLAVGLVAMLAAGVSPLDPAPSLELARLPEDVLAGRPEAFLWLGLIAVITTPTARVLLALVNFVRSREVPMAAVATGVLGVIALSVIVARLAES